MRKQIFCFALCAMLFALSVPGEVQQAAKVARIGFLGSLSRSVSLKAFREGLRELGYVEGQNIVIEYRFAEGKAEQYPELAAELVHLKVDVIVVANTRAARAAKKATTTIPIVIAAMGGDPVRTGLVASLARPGGNVTGFTMLVPELGGKQLELLKEAFPSVSRVAVLRGPGRTGTATFRQIETVAQALGVELYSMVVGATNPDLDKAFEAAIKREVGALIVVTSQFLTRHKKRIAELAAKRRLPAIFHHRLWVKAGGLFSYGPNRSDLYRGAVTYVDKILKGAKPADLPVQQPTRFYLIINLKAAKKIGFTIPPSILYRADKVIK